MRSLLLAARVSNFEGELFIPMDKLDGIVSRENVAMTLSRVNSADLRNSIEKIVQDTVQFSQPPRMSTRRKIFAILAMVGRPVDIQDFIDENIYDADLPLFHVRDEHGKICLARRGHEKTTSIIQRLGHWSRLVVEDFTTCQWQILSPFFSLATSLVSPSSEPLHYELSSRTVLPFSMDVDPQDGGSRRISGGFGTVYRVTIHPSHVLSEPTEVSG